MKLKLLFGTFAIGMILFAGCSYDDTDIRNKVEKLDTRLTELEKVVKEININVGSLMTVVEALKTEDRIESVLPLEDGTGYIITFSKSGPITIYHGKDGEDGKTPAISVGQDVDGLYYWKVNGDWLYDGENKIPATSKTEIPQIRVNEDSGHFELSFDGETWQDIGSAGGAGIFKDVIDGEDEVTFILSGDKEPIVIPKAQKFALIVDNTSVPVETPGASIMVSYTVVAADKGTTVEAIATGGFVIESITSQTIENEVKGSVTIQIPDPLPVDGKVFLFAVNSKGTPSMRILSFEKGEFNLDVLGNLNVKAEGGEILLSVMTNYNYTIEAPEWITHKVEVLTRAVRMEMITLTIEENKEAERSASVSFVDGMTVRHTITVTQEGVSIEEPGYKGPIEDWKDDGSIDF